MSASKTYSCQYCAVDETTAPTFKRTGYFKHIKTKEHKYNVSVNCERISREQLLRIAKKNSYGKKCFKSAVKKEQEHQDSCYKHYKQIKEKVKSVDVICSNVYMK